MPETALIKCPRCGATNRVPIEKLHEHLLPVCGRCKTSLPASIEPIHLTDSNFSENVERSSIPVLVDLWAAWCAPCRAIAPIVEQIANEFAGRLTVGKLTIDEKPSTTARFGVRSIPTLLLFRDGKEIDRIIGAVAKQEIVRRVQSAI